MVTGSYDNTVRIWDCRSRMTDPIDTMREAKDSVSSVCVSGHFIFAGSVDGCIRMYDVRMGQVSADHVHHPVTSVNLSNDGACVLASCLDNTLRLLDRESGEVLCEYIGHKHSQYKIESCLSKSDSHVVSGSEDGKIYFWDLVEANKTQVLDAHDKACVVSVTFSPKSNCFLSASVDGTAKLWV
mmetsp:Transcript_71404/g.168285  ORF Transcript_71404/g.168285 Transcript_71404/m.168285 type:complete len:184 (-) Transcript_71404:1561-2112(-)